MKNIITIIISLVVIHSTFGQSSSERLLNYINSYRISIGLSKLTLDNRLTNAAKIQNDNNIKYQKCDHILKNVDLKGNTHPIWYKMEKSGYVYSEDRYNTDLYPNENTSQFKYLNLYKDTLEKCTYCKDIANYILDGYLNSPGHKKAIEGKYHTKVGIITETVGEYTYNTMLLD